MAKKKAVPAAEPAEPQTGLSMAAKRKKAAKQSPPKEAQAAAPPKRTKRAAAKKKKTSAKDLTAEQRTLGMYHLVHQREKAGIDSGSVFVDSNLTVTLGLRIPFILQYVLGVAVLPLGVVVEVNGPPMSSKTMLTYYFGKLFAEANGWFDFLVTEGKISTNLAYSVMGWKKLTRASFRPQLCDSMQSWQVLQQKWLLDGLAFYKKGAPELGIKPGARWPILTVVDSIMGANMSETDENITTAGSGRRFAIEALSLTSYLRRIGSLVAERPILACYINHLKEEEPDPSKPYVKAKSTRPGGKQLRFQETLELTMHRAMKKRPLADKSDHGGLEIEARVLRITCNKNSLGTDGRSIEVEVRWHHRELPSKGGKRRKIQVTRWRWGEALVQFLIKWQKGQHMGGGKEATGEGRMHRLDKFIHIRPGVKTGTFYSHTLGMEKSDAVSAEELGNQIDQNDEIIDRLRIAFGVTDGEIWTPGEDYKEQRAKLTAAAQKVSYEAAFAALSVNDEDQRQAEREARADILQRGDDVE